MGKYKPAPLTPEQVEAINMRLQSEVALAVAHAFALVDYTLGIHKRKPAPPADLDPQVAQVTGEWLDSVGLRAEELVMADVCSYCGDVDGPCDACANERADVAA